MGMNAEVMVLGPIEILKFYGVLDYPDGFYKDMDPNALVWGTIAIAHTNDTSRMLADVCGVRPWDLANHFVTNPQLVHEDEVITDEGETGKEIYEVLKGLLEHRSVSIYFRPNG